MTFPSTLLPRDNTVDEVKKAILDLLDKLNKTATGDQYTLKLETSYVFSDHANPNKIYFWTKHEPGALIIFDVATGTITAAVLSVGTLTATAITVGTLTVTTLIIPDASIAVSKLLASASPVLFGRTTAGAGAGEEITVGTSLSFAALALNTIQDIRTTAKPQFSNLALGIAWTRAVLELRGGTGAQYFSDANVAHGMTGILPTDVFASIGIVNANSGGLLLSGLTDTVDVNAVRLRAYLATDSTAAGIAAVNITASKASGVNDQALAATGKLLTINNFSTNDLFTILGSGFVGLNDPAPSARFTLLETDTAQDTAIEIRRNNSAGDYLTMIRFGFNGLRVSKSSAGADAISTWTRWSLTNDRWEAEATTTVGPTRIDFSTSGAITFNTCPTAARVAGDALPFVIPLRLDPTGGARIGDNTVPTAHVHIKAGSATAGDGPLKIDAGTVLGTTEAGAIENDGTHLYYTPVAAGARFQLDQQGGGGLSHPQVMARVSMGA